MNNKKKPESVIDYELIKQHFNNDTRTIVDYLQTLPKEELLEIKEFAILNSFEEGLILSMLQK